MKFILQYLIYSLIVCFCMNASAQTHYQEILRYKNSSIQSILTYNNQNVLDGETVHFYPNEKIKTVINFQNGKANGLFQNYYSNGNLESTGLLVNDLAEGVFEYFYENGYPKQKITFINNLIVEIKDCYTIKKQQVYCGVVNSGNGFINIYDKKGNVIAKDIIKEGKMVKREPTN